MNVKVHVVDPANAYHLDQNPNRNGWHNLFGTEADALNGSISRVFLTGVPQNVPSYAVTQDSDYCCGGAAIAIAIGKTADRECHNWLESRGYMTSAYGTEYSGIVACLNAYGYSCSYDGKAYDSYMSGNFYNQIINHLQSGYKVILCMHGIGRGGRTDFYTKNGHYICLDGIDGTTTTTDTSKITVDGLWGQATTKKAQRVLGTTVDGIISNQNKDMKKYLQNCQTSSWEFVDASKLSGGSELVRAIQRKVGVTADGFFGLQTTKALQKFLGVTVDGYFGPKSVKAFQTWLNK